MQEEKSNKMPKATTKRGRRRLDPETEKAIEDSLRENREALAKLAKL